MSQDASLMEEEWALLDDVADDWYGLWEVDWWFNAVYPEWPFESRLGFLSNLVQRGLIEIFFGPLGRESPALKVSIAVEAISLREAWLPLADINEATYHVSTSGVGRAAMSANHPNPPSP